MEKNSQRGWLSRQLTVKLHRLYSNKENETKSIDLHTATAVQDLHTGFSSSSFLDFVR